MARKKQLDQRKVDAKRKEEGDWEDIDEHEKDVFDKEGFFDVMETEVGISAND